MHPKSQTLLEVHIFMNKRCLSSEKRAERSEKAKIINELRQRYPLKDLLRLSGLFEKLPKDARPVFHSDQGWQYQHKEYQRLLAEHNIIQSMSRKGNCMDNGSMENFFGRLKVEMFYGENFESVNAFIKKLNEYIYYCNNDRISLKLKGMSPIQFRTHSFTA